MTENYPRRKDLRTRRRVPVPIREWLYNIAIATAPLITAYGVISEDTAALWLGLVQAVLGVTSRAHLERSH